MATKTGITRSLGISEECSLAILVTHIFLERFPVVLAAATVPIWNTRNILFDTLTEEKRVFFFKDSFWKLTIGNNCSLHVCELVHFKVWNLLQFIH